MCEGRASKSKKQCPNRSFGANSEDVQGAVVQIGEAALRIGGPDQVMRSLDQIAVAAFAFQQQLDDAPLLAQCLACRGEFVFVLVGGNAQRRARQSVDDLARITPMAAVGPASHQNALGIPAAQLLDRHAELGGGLLNRVFGRKTRHANPHFVRGGPRTAEWFLPKKRMKQTSMHPARACDVVLARHQSLHKLQVPA